MKRRAVKAVNTEISGPSIFAERLGLAMKMNDMSGVELASRAGISPASVTRYLQGKHMPSALDAYQMAKALGVTVEWLLGGAPVDVQLGSTLAEAASRLHTIGRILRQFEPKLRDLLEAAEFPLYYGYTFEVEGSSEEESRPEAPRLGKGGGRHKGPWKK